MENIIIVECISTGINYIQDIIDRNYNPIVLELKLELDSEEGQKYAEIIHSEYERIDNEFEIIYEKDSYEETLEMVKKYNPKLILPGNEKGVRLATKLANDLNLLCNPIENLDAMTYKNEMHKRLAEKGLRHIKGKVVKSVEEAIEYFDSEGFDQVVVKPVYSAASVGVKICMNREEMIDAVSKSFSKHGYYGNAFNEVLIQERITGDEYIVNTVSCDGVHRITAIWKYGKITTSEGGQIYDSCTIVSDLNLGESEMVEYAYDVADALGIKYGPVHGEYMIDEKGPVLIEVNCRPCGGNMEADFLNRITGQHETDSSLDSYLNPEKFHIERQKGYKLIGYGALKFFIVPEDLIATSAPMTHISSKLKSHYKTSITQIIGHLPFAKTKDLETAPGIVYLVDENPYQVQKDMEFLKSIEKYAFQLVLSEGLEKNISINEEETYENIKTLLNEMKAFGTSLLITDSIYDDLDTIQVTPAELKGIKGEFDLVIVNLNKSLLEESDDAIASFILNTFDKIRIGGLLIIPKETYDAMPSGRLGAEALVKTLNLRIQLPLHNFPKMLIASKK